MPMYDDIKLNDKVLKKRSNKATDEDLRWDKIQYDRWNEVHKSTGIVAEPSFFKFSKRSFNSLRGVDPRLSVVFGTAIQHSPHDFIIIEGLRTKERQQELFDQGLSTTLNSRHITGHAIDIAAWIDGDVSWETHYYKDIADHVKRVASEHSVSIDWGGDWSSFKDYVHFQLSWET